MMFNQFKIESPYNFVCVNDIASGEVVTYKQYKTGKKEEVERRPMTEKELKEGKKKLEAFKKSKQAQGVEVKRKAMQKEIKPQKKRKPIDYKEEYKSLKKRVKVLKKRSKTEQERLKQITRLLEEHKEREKILFDAVHKYVNICDALASERESERDRVAHESKDTSSDNESSYSSEANL